MHDLLRPSTAVEQCYHAPGGSGCADMSASSASILTLLVHRVITLIITGVDMEQLKAALALQLPGICDTRANVDALDLQSNDNTACFME